MPPLRFNHMELTLAKGALDEKTRADLKRFYVRFLLPIWFDVQCMEHAPGAAPQQGWRWGPLATLPPEPPLA